VRETQKRESEMRRANPPSLFSPPRQSSASATATINGSLHHKKEQQRQHSQSFMVYLVTLVGIACTVGLLSSFYLTTRLDQQHNANQQQLPLPQTHETHPLLATPTSNVAVAVPDTDTDTDNDTDNDASSTTDLSHLDARDSFTKFQEENRKHLNQKAASSSSTASISTSTTVPEVRAEFEKRYGAATAATILSRGVQEYGSVDATAVRMLTAAAAGRSLVLSFAGYSVTVGRGNHLQQSFPFVVQRILEPVLQHSPYLQMNVTVRNAAIGGIPSFPYGFCFEHFLGRDADVISWDYSMNEGNGAAVLESYLRQSQQQLPNRPMVILLDTNKRRCSVMETYTKQGLLADGLCVGMAKDVLDKSLLDQLNQEGNDDSHLPVGLQHWQDFGAPQKCPGRGSWHPKRMEHELIGWMMAMYFIKAVEQAEAMAAANANWKTTYGATGATSSPHGSSSASSSPALRFPATIHTPPDNDADVTELLFGHAATSTDNSSKEPQYSMKQLSCRTSFLPAVDQDKVIPSVVVSGLSPGITADNIMDDRSDTAYQSGWVLDVSKVERQTKVKVEQCGGLGYVDMKIALYGIPESGPLRLWLPLEGESAHLHGEHDHTDDDTAAKHWFDDVVVCEANEKRPPKACQLDSDVEYTVGGVVVTSTRMIAGAGEYLKRKTCVNVGVPANAQVTRLGDVRAVDGSAISPQARIRLAGSGEHGDDRVGLIVDVKVKNNVSRDNGACCLSHIVWEQH
jgi:CheY-like chemotaxis protein